MSMVTVAAVATVGSAAYGAYNSNKNAKGVRNAYGDVMKYAQRNPGVFGEKIEFEPVDYSPLFKSDPGYGKIAGDTIAGNQRNLPAGINLMQGTNAAITQDSLTRLNALYPQFQGQFNQQSRNTSNLLSGLIPQEDRNAITARRTEAQSLGGGGANQQQVAADLGLTRMQAMEAGAANLTNNMNLWNAIDPISRRVTPQSMFVDPSQAIQSSIAENQFASTFAAQERDAEINYGMLPDPQKAGMLNLLSGKAGVQAATPMQSVGGAALSALGPALMGAYGTNKASQQWNQPLQSQPGYVGTTYGAPTNATGYGTFQNLSASPTFAYGNLPTNPAYAGQGSLASQYRSKPPTSYSSWGYNY